MRGVCVSLPTTFHGGSLQLLLPCCSLPISKRYFPILCSISARDIVIDFGKYKGNKMGTLPSNYLRWITRELGGGRSRIWAEYAEEVLQDPFYRDRLEWETIERIMVKGDMRKGKLPSGDVSALSSMKAFGWDLENRSAWNKVNLSALGTSSGGRIPRKETVDQDASAKKKVQTNVAVKKVPIDEPLRDEVPESQSLSLREELLRRRRQRRGIVSTDSPAKGATTMRFPGRDVLLEKSNNYLEQ